MSVYIRDMHTNQLTGPEVSSVPPAAPPATAVEATARELIEILCVDIKIGERYRRDMGDLEALAASIKAEGLLQPIGVTEDRALVFGERRLRAVQDILNRDTITARVVRVSSIVAGEYAENEVRKDFTPSERAAIAKAIEDQIPERRGGTNPEKFPDWKGKETREIVAEKAGFGNAKTYEQARKVVAQGTPELVAAMDTKTVSISTSAELAELPPEEQRAAVAGGKKKATARAAAHRKAKKAVRASKKPSTVAPRPDLAPAESQTDADGPVAALEPRARMRKYYGQRVKELTLVVKALSAACKESDHYANGWQALGQALAILSAALREVQNPSGSGPAAKAKQRSAKKPEAAAKA